VGGGCSVYFTVQGKGHVKICFTLGGLSFFELDQPPALAMYHGHHSTPAVHTVTKLNIAKSTCIVHYLKHTLCPGAAVG
jgi:hypothetical protein